MMQRDLLALAKVLNVGERQLDRIGNQTRYREAKPFAPTFPQRQPFVRCGHLPIRPEVRRDIGPRIARTAAQTIDDILLQRAKHPPKRHLQKPRPMPRDPMRDSAGRDNARESDESPDQTRRAPIIRAGHDMVHILTQPGNHDHRDVRDEKRRVTAQRQKMNQTRLLPTAEQPWIPQKAVIDRRRHRQAGQQRHRSDGKHHAGVSQLLQRVVAVKAIRLDRQMKRRVMHHHAPSVDESLDVSRQQSAPLPRPKK